jgi:predicted DNA-binding transcriptional regulator YafY
MPAKVNSEVANNIYKALLSSKQIKATYLNRAGQEKVHEHIHPLGIVHQGASIYLACRIGEHQEATKTALHRFKDVIVLAQNVNSDNFDLSAWINKEFSAHLDSTLEDISLKVRFRDGAVFHLTESPINETQALTKEGDGWTLVEVTVTDTDELRWWLLGFGAGVEVISPKPMRKWFKDVAKEMAKNYVK